MSVADFIGPPLAIGLGVAELVAVWRWGFKGCMERTRWLVDRVAHGPAPRRATPRPDYAEIARLEREVGFAEPESYTPGAWSTYLTHLWWADTAPAPASRVGDDTEEGA